MIEYLIILVLSFLCVTLLLVIRHMKHAEGITKDWLYNIRACHDDAIRELESQNIQLKEKVDNYEEFITFCHEESGVMDSLSERFKAKKELGNDK